MKTATTFAGINDSDDEDNGLPRHVSDWRFGTHYVEIPSLEVARRMLGPSSAKIRRQRSAVYTRATGHQVRSRLPLGMHDRGEEYVLAGGYLTPGDLKAHAVHLPLHVKVIRQSEHRIGGNDVFDVTVSHTTWPGLPLREELYVYAKIDRLLVEPGAVLEVHGNVFILEVNEIVLLSSDSKRRLANQAAFEIRIRGTRHPAYSAIRNRPAFSGRAGIDGRHAKHNRSDSAHPSPFGPLPTNVSSDLNGADGADGSAGSSGGHGQNGGLAMLADLRIGALRDFAPGSLRISAQAGDGQPGGAGGPGGSGGHGGDGADGLHSVQFTRPGGRGGAGGKGGHGGDGGHGGHGGLASNIFIQIPATYRAQLDPVSLASCGGSGGQGGVGGMGGNGGKHGAHYQSKSVPADQSTQRAKAGQPGMAGQSGRHGRSRPGPAIYIFHDQ